MIFNQQTWSFGGGAFNDCNDTSASLEENVSRKVSQCGWVGAAAAGGAAVASPADCLASPAHTSYTK